MVAANRDVLAAVRQALRGEYAEPQQFRVSGVFRNYRPLRNAAAGLIAQSQVLAGSGRWDAAGESALDAMELGSKMPRGAAFFSALIGRALLDRGRLALEGCLLHLSPGDVDPALARVGRIRALLPSFAETIENERVIMRAVFADFFSQYAGSPPWRAGDLFGQVTDPRWYQPADFQRRALAVAFTPKRAALESMDRYYASVAVEMRKPWGQAREPEIPEDAVNQNLVGRRFLPSYRGWLQTQAYLAAQETWLMARRYEFRHGLPPATGEELAPQPLPADPFTGRPCVYRRRAKVFVVYSLGPDRRDDSGRPVTTAGRFRGGPGDLVVGP